jgi:phage terminase large subunit
LSVVFTKKQLEADALLKSPATHVLLYGGARSGKDFVALYNIIERALTCKSKHLILRKNLNHVFVSIARDALPKIISLCFPELVDQCKLDKDRKCYIFPNGSEIWFSGCDDEELTEKILTQKYATIFFKQCSLISYEFCSSILKRLDIDSTIPHKVFYTCIPSKEGYWIYQLFIRRIYPDSGKPIEHPEDYACLRIGTEDNIPHLPDGYLDELKSSFNERNRRRFILGEFDESY